MSNKRRGILNSGLKKFLTVMALLVFIVHFSSYSQIDRRKRREARKKQQKIEQQVYIAPKEEITDSLKAIIDSTARADSLFSADSVKLLKQSSLSHPAFSGGKDSILTVFTDGQRKIYYYGDVEVSYDNMKLKADFMEYDMNTGTVYAKGTLDTLTKEWKGQPEMQQGSQSYNMEEVKYNFKTKKASVKNMITKEADGILHGQNINMMPDKSINITSGKYTVCDLEHPHYYLKLTAAKVITKPSQKTVFGPAYPVIEDVPLPIGLPFGFIPKRPDRATGLLIPTFGEEQARGFYLRDMGMYFVLGENFDISVTSDIYTLGSWSVDINSRYKVNYKRSGDFSINYSNDQTGEKGSTDFFKTTNFGVKWSHHQDPKARPGTSFSASVNFSSPSNSRYNSHSVDQALTNQVSSSISYSKNWNGKYNLSINALHNQNSRDSSYSFTLPNVTFSVSRFYPFKQKNRVGKEKFYEKFSLAYNTTLQNRINFKSKEFMKDGFLDKFNNGMAHNFQIGLPGFTLAKYFNFTPGVSYGMNWFFKKREQHYNSTTGQVEQEEGKQFNTFGITQNYSGSLSMSTRLYGMFNFGKYHKIQAIRHVITPSISMSFSPEKGTAANGWRSLRYVDKNGQVQERDYNIYAGQINSPPGRGKSASASISIGNNLEAKVRDLRDTTGKGIKKVKLIDQLNLHTSYNFLADSLKMSNIGMSISTSIFGKLGISGNLNFDPYAINEQGRKINKFNISKEGWAHPLRLTNASASLSYSLSGKGAINGNDGRKSGQGGGQSESPADAYMRVYYHPVTGEYIPGGWLYYMNPNSPWSLNVNYSFSFSRSYSYINDKLIQNDRYNQTLGLSGNIKLTPKMAINMSSGFDLMARKVTTTQFSATYDLHCFNISVNWVPTGNWKSYGFRISANASALADLLKYKKNSSYWDR